MRRSKLRSVAARLLVPLLLTLAAACPACSQGSRLKQLLDGNGVPTTIRAKDRTTDYRVVQVAYNRPVTLMQMQMFG